MPTFNIKQENDLIKTGHYFWCSTCCTARPIEEKVKDGRCRSCNASLKREDLETSVNLLHTPQDEYLSDLPVEVGKPVSKNNQGVLL